MKKETIKQCVYGAVLLACILCSVILLYIGQYWACICLFGLSIVLFSMILEYINLLEIRYYGRAKEK